MKSFAALASPLLLVNQVLGADSVCSGYNFGLSTSVDVDNHNLFLVVWNDACEPLKYFDNPSSGPGCFGNSNFNCVDGNDKSKIIYTDPDSKENLKYTCWQNNIPQGTCHSKSATYQGITIGLPDDGSTMGYCCASNSAIHN